VSLQGIVGTRLAVSANRVNYFVGIALAIYREAKGFPSDERYGLTSQIRRAASSIPANIAEGCGRDTEADLARFMQIAMGSASELEYHLLLSKDLALLDDVIYSTLHRDTVEIKRMLAPFINKLRKR
jgi:four helix bundle protein